MTAAIASQSPVDRILSRLNRTKQSGVGWTAQCPAHEDRHNSLKLDTGRQDEALIHCFAGCEPEAIVAALGLKMVDLYPPSTKQPRLKIDETRYQVRDTAGQLQAIHVKIRYADGSKAAPWMRPDGQWGLAGRQVTSLPFYGAHAVAALTRSFVIVEGEAARDALAGVIRNDSDLAVLGTVTGAGAIPDDDVLASILGTDNIVLWADADQPGEDHMRRLAERLIELGQPPDRIRSVEWVDAPFKGADVADFIALGRGPEEARALLAAAVPVTPEAAPPLSPTEPDDDGVSQFPLNVLPRKIRRFVESAAASIGCPPDFVAVPLLGLAEGCMGKSRRLVLRPGFEVLPGSWFGIIGEPGVGKSPALKRALSVVRSLQDEAWDRYQQALAAWELLPKEDRGTRPEPEHVYVTDATGEALWAALASSPGLTQVEDELRRRLKALDAYRQAGDRQTMLGLWSNAPVKIIRRTSPPIYIPCPVAPLVGGIQPGVLRYLRGEGEDTEADDGWMPRFMLCWPDAEPLALSDVPFDEATQQSVEAIFRTLRLSGTEPVDTKLSAPAYARFRQWHEQNRAIQITAKGLERQWAAKAPVHLARLALVLHLLSEAAEKPELPESTLDDAIELVEFFRTHLARVLPVFGASATTRLHKRITRIVNEARLESESGWVSRTAIRDGLRNVTPVVLTAAMEVLQVSGQLEHRRVETTTRPRDEWRLTRQGADEDACGDSGYSGNSSTLPEHRNTRDTGRRGPDEHPHNDDDGWETVP